MPASCSRAISAVGETQHLRREPVGMLAEARRRAGRLARAAREIERQARHRIAADAGLVDFGEERVVRRAARVVAHQLDKILKRPPQHAAAGKGRRDLGERLARRTSARAAPRSRRAPRSGRSRCRDRPPSSSPIIASLSASPVARPIARHCRGVSAMIMTRRPSAVAKSRPKLP